MEHVSKLFRKQCNICKTERMAVPQATSSTPPTAAASPPRDGCLRPDNPVADKKEFLPAPLAHYCCRCARTVGWARFESHACTACKHKHDATEGEPLPVALDGDDWRGSRGGAGKEDADDLYVKIGFCEEGEEEASERARKLAAVEMECNDIRAAAIEEARREAEAEVARILTEAQNSARQQAAEEREGLLREAQEQANAIVEKGRAEAKEELERVLSEADKILNNASSEAASIIDEARTSVAPAGAWVEVGLSGSGGWHRPAMAVFFRGELAAATHNFAASNCVGAGGFGSVFRAQHIQGLGNGAPMAIKRLDHGSMQGQGEFLQELQVLGACRHEHLLPVLGFAADGVSAGEAVCLVSPLMVGGNLEDRLLMTHKNAEARERLRLLSANPPAAAHPNGAASGRAASGGAWAGAADERGVTGILSWQDRVRCCTALLRALVYLHVGDTTRCKPAILHRDIKPANLLLDANNNARLADVGLAQILKGSKSHVSNSMLAGTHGFLDPHYSQTGQFDAAADGYAVGLSLPRAGYGVRGHVFGKRPRHVHVLRLASVL